MKVLVATRTSQGLESIDAFDAEEGEVVVPEFCSDCGLPSGGTFRGLESNGHTTSALTAERPDYDMQSLVMTAIVSYESHHRIDRLVDDTEEFNFVCGELFRLFTTIQQLDAGMVVRRNGDDLYVLPQSQVEEYK